METSAGLPDFRAAPGISVDSAHDFRHRQNDLDKTIYTA